MAVPRGRSWGDIRRASMEGIADGINDTARIVQERGNELLEAKKKIDEGTLLGSAELEEASQDALQAVSKWSVSYAKYVHYGAGPAIGNPPFWPPEEPIRKWVERNLQVDPRGGERKTVIKPRLRKGLKDPTQQEIDRVTYLVRKKIHDKGIEPTPFATAGREEAIKAGPLLVRDGINESMQRLR